MRDAGKAVSLLSTTPVITKTRGIVVCVLLLGTAWIGRADVLFQGVVSAGTQQQFALQDTGAGVSRWCRIGDTFAGWTIRAYDAERDRLLCSSGEGAEVWIDLNVAVVRELKSTPADERYGQVYLAPEFREKLRQEAKSEADVFRTALLALEDALAKAETDQDRAELSALIDGFKVGRVKLYETGGRPFRYDELPHMSREAVDRINKLQTMTREEVDALIKSRSASKRNASD